MRATHGTPSSLQVLVELAEHRSQEVARNLGLLINRGEQGEAKLQMLRNYLQEYRTRLDDAVREGLEPERLRNYLAFIARLETGDRGTGSGSGHRAGPHRRGKGALARAGRERRTFETLLERRRTEGKRLEARNEQKQLDEIATRTALRQPGR